MSKLIASWREIVHDFGWPVLTLVFIYGAVSAIINWQSQNLWLFGENSRRLIAFILWLTIIALTVPHKATSIPVKQPLSELIYLMIWGIAVAFYVIYFPSLASVTPRWTWYIYAIQSAYVLGNIVLAVLFALIFKYSPQDLGIHLKHWRLYLGLIILAFPSSWYFGGKSQIVVGMVIIVALFILYCTNTTRWQGLADDLRSFRSYVLPIFLCGLVTIIIAWARGNERVLDVVALPFRISNTGSMIQGAGPEEFYYRLGLQTRLTSYMPFGWASLIQGIAFDASHIPQGLVHGLYLPSEVPWQFFTGIANALAGGYFWLRSRNLPATILFHLVVFI